MQARNQHGGNREIATLEILKKNV